MDLTETIGIIRELLSEQKDPDDMDTRLADHGYEIPQQGTGGHITYTSRNNSEEQMLIDVPGGEWHHMTKGVVNKIGKMNDGSLEDYLSNN